MEFVVKVGDIVMLEDELNYRVLDCVELDGNGYVILKKFELTVDSVLQLDNAKEIVVQEVIDNEDDYFLQIVTDQDILKRIEKLSKKINK
jgi:hypothetical protein